MYSFGHSLLSTNLPPEDEGGKQSIDFVKSNNHAVCSQLKCTSKGSKMFINRVLFVLYFLSFYYWLQSYQRWLDLDDNGSNLKRGISNLGLVSLFSCTMHLESNNHKHFVAISIKALSYVYTGYWLKCSWIELKQWTLGGISGMPFHIRKPQWRCR
jgi:hypothetical protein